MNKIILDAAIGPQEEICTIGVGDETAFELSVALFLAIATGTNLDNLAT